MSLTKEQIENVRRFLSGQADGAEESRLYNDLCNMALRTEAAERKKLELISEVAVAIVRAGVPAFGYLTEGIQKLGAKLQAAEKDTRRWRAFAENDLAYSRTELVNAQTGGTIPGQVRWTIWWTGPDRSMFRDAIDAALQEKEKA